MSILDIRFRQHLRLYPSMAYEQEFKSLKKWIVRVVLYMACHIQMRLFYMLFLANNDTIRR